MCCIFPGISDYYYYLRDNRNAYTKHQQRFLHHNYFHDMCCIAKKEIGYLVNMYRGKKPYQHLSNRFCVDIVDDTLNKNLQLLDRKSLLHDILYIHSFAIVLISNIFRANYYLLDRSILIYADMYYDKRNMIFHSFHRCNRFHDILRNQ